MEKLKNLSLIQKMQLKIISLIVFSAIIILAIACITVSVYTYNTDVKNVQSALEAANEDAAKTYTETKNKENIESMQNELNNLRNNILRQFNFGGSDFFDDTPNSNDNKSGNLSPSNPSNQNSDSLLEKDLHDSPVDINGFRRERPNSISVASYVFIDGKLQIIDNNLVNAYLAETTLNNACSLIQENDYGFHTIQALDVVYSKDKHDGTDFVSFADIAEISSWQDIAKNFIWASVLIIIMTLIGSIIFAKHITKPIKEAWDSQERFIADASHDLKTPLTVILTNSSILLEDKKKPTESQKQWLVSTQNQANKMFYLINDMLEMARVEDFAKNRKLHMRDIDQVDISEIVLGICLQFEAVAYDRKIKFNSDISKNIKIEANKEDVVQAITTIIENSCKHAVDDDSIEIVLKKSKGKAILTVVNKKTLIEKEDLPHIFDRFYRSNKSRDDDSSDNTKQSHGLGLAIAKSIITQYGGSIDVDSSKGKGTAFTIKFKCS